LERQFDSITVGAGNDLAQGATQVMTFELTPTDDSYQRPPAFAAFLSNEHRRTICCLNACKATLTPSPISAHLSVDIDSHPSSQIPISLCSASSISLSSSNILSIDLIPRLENIEKPRAEQVTFEVGRAPCTLPHAQTLSSELGKMSAFISKRVDVAFSTRLLALVRFDSRWRAIT
jgi:hypothetical protein